MTEITYINVDVTIRGSELYIDDHESGEQLDVYTIEERINPYD